LKSSRGFFLSYLKIKRLLCLSLSPILIIEDHIYRLFFIVSCASNLGISHQSLSRWQKKLRETGDIESRGSGNYACSSEIDFIAFE
ncbi:MAG: hypothetical protein ACLRH4_17770, partial [Anaerobutyricum hallii]